MDTASPFYHPRSLTKKAWISVKAGASRFGGSPALYIAQALRIVWAEAKRIAREAAEAEARVLACVAQMKAEGAFNPPATRRDPLFVRTVPYGRGGGRSLGFRGL